MLDEEVGDEATPADGRRTSTTTFVLSATGLGILLSVAFFPSFFNTVEWYDDEGSFLVVIRQFLHHGSLYVHTHGPYGPFYFSIAGLLFRLTGHDPTLFSGRLIVLVFTALSAGMFAATVWRVTRSLAFALLCEVSTYVVLISIAGNEPMHPGSLIVLLLSVLAYALASYAMQQRISLLVMAGVAIGALAMIKVNIGVFAATAVVVAFVVGNSQYSKRVRGIVAAAGLLLPFGLMFQLLYQIQTAQFAVIVSVGLLLTYVPLSVDTIDLPRRALWVMTAAAGVTIAVSCVWPLATGTSPGALFHGVVIQPLGQSANLSVAANVNFQWLAFLFAVCGAWVVLARRHGDAPTRSERSWQFDVALAVAGLSVLGFVVFGGFGAWLPAIALLPALAWMGVAPPHVRLALRFLVPLAILQLLHAYPVAASQATWGRVAVCVPCTIAMAAALQRLTTWRQAGPALRALAVGSLGLVLIVVGFWPGAAWHSYDKGVPLGLPGARLVRIDPVLAKTYQRLTAVVRRRCDTFYSAPAFDSLYIFTGMAAPTGLLANGPSALDVKEQRELAGQLAGVQAKGKRVCIVRMVSLFPHWQAGSEGHGPLGRALAPYTNQIARIGNYSVSLRNASNGST